MKEEWKTQKLKISDDDGEWKHWQASMGLIGNDRQ